MKAGDIAKSKIVERVEVENRSRKRHAKKT